ncbi:uncharacterized protein LOC129976643 [Argiope bruennichi]|uniref:uncharacterized protein LOC129976643 n=1 Tax=Argiope bruennichi TaxID=94029 RepID=UPI002494969D|nr:uncharacterized protein LOC129976643 [Argiope bruennichi]
MFKYLAHLSLCPHPRAVEPEDVSIPMSLEMRKRNMHSYDFAPNRSEFAVPGIGYYRCDICYNYWRCAYAWVVVDLRKPNISYRWKMKCKYCCFHEKHAGVTPVFAVEEIKNLTKKAINLYLYELFMDLDLGLYQIGSKGPHPKELCERCEWGKKECWKTCKPARLPHGHLLQI